jgi:serine O-acetyltransferase
MSERLSPWKLILEDLSVQREWILSQGFWALFVHRLANPRMRARRGIFRKIWAVLNRVAIKWIEVVGGISIGESAQIGRRLIIEHFGGIIVHGRTVIGDDCLIRQGVTIGNRSEEDAEGAPVLGNGVVVGAGAKILGRITIGDGAVIGANAVVVKDVPAGGVVVGIPARLIRVGGAAAAPKAS